MTDFIVEKFDADLDYHSRHVGDIVALSHESYMVPLDEESLRLHQYPQIAFVKNPESGETEFAGYAAVTHEYSRRVIELGSLMVAEKFRRMGLAKRLIGAVYEPASQTWPDAQILAFSNMESRALFEGIGGVSIGDPAEIPDEVWKVCEDCNSYEESVIQGGQTCCGRVYDISEIEVSIASSMQTEAHMQSTPEALEDNMQEFLYGEGGAFNQVLAYLESIDLGDSSQLVLTADGVKAMTCTAVESGETTEYIIKDSGKNIAFRIVVKHDGGISVTKSSTIAAIRNKSWHYQVTIPSANNFEPVSLISRSQWSSHSSSTIPSSEIHDTEQLRELHDYYERYKSYIRVVLHDLNEVFASS